MLNQRRNSIRPVNSVYFRLICSAFPSHFMVCFEGFIAFTDISHIAPSTLRQTEMWKRSCHTENPSNGFCPLHARGQSCSISVLECSVREITRLSCSHPFEQLCFERFIEKSKCADVFRWYFPMYLNCYNLFESDVEIQLGQLIVFVTSEKYVLLSLATFLINLKTSLLLITFTIFSLH